MQYFTETLANGVLLQGNPLSSITTLKQFTLSDRHTEMSLSPIGRIQILTYLTPETMCQLFDSFVGSIISYAVRCGAFLETVLFKS